jgi:hypothetical protein
MVDGFESVPMVVVDVGREARFRIELKAGNDGKFSFD